jgi:hypothetical protein
MSFDLLELLHIYFTKIHHHSQSHSSSTISIQFVVLPMAGRFINRIHAGQSKKLSICTRTAAAGEPISPIGGRGCSSLSDWDEGKQIEESLINWLFRI